jgi:hypothetical protein
MSKFRKKYSSQEAKQTLDTLYQMFFTNQECIEYWQTQPQTKTDKLIQALVGKTTEEMILENEKSNKYILEKIEYVKQFLPKYKQNLG